MFSILETREAYKKKKQEEYLRKLPAEIDQIALVTFLNTEMEKYDVKYNNKFDSLKKAYEDILWNKEKVDFAIALLGSSPDSLKKVKAMKYSCWLTGGFPLSTWGEMLLGGSYDYLVSSKNYDLFFNSRIYAGINRAKGFIEVQYNYKKNDLPKKLLLNIGAELSLFSGFWINYYAGIEYTKVNSATTNSFVSHFDLRYDVP